MLVAFVLMAALASTQALIWQNCGKLLYSLYTSVFYLHYCILCALYGVRCTTVPYVHCSIHCSLLYRLYVAFSVLPYPRCSTVFTVHY